MQVRKYKRNAFYGKTCMCPEDPGQAELLRETRQMEEVTSEPSPLGSSLWVGI